MARIRFQSVLSFTVVAALALAGCTGDDAGDGTSNTGDDNLDLQIEGEVDQISLTYVGPDPSADNGTTLLACWEMEGQGTVPHTGLVYDNRSHSGEGVEPGDYTGGEALPDNGTEESDDGYPVRAYCTTVPYDGGQIFMRAHVIVDRPPGMLSEERAYEA